MTENNKKVKLGLIPRLLIAIGASIFIGSFLPPVVTQIAVTVSANFGKLLGFIIPLMIIAFVTKGMQSYQKVRENFY